MIINSKFRPRWWLSNPHLQTIYASKIGKRPSIDTARERVTTPDGDFLDLNSSKRTSGPLVCLFHGLAGCIDSAYAKGVFGALENAGMRPVFMHWRGCSGEPNLRARSYHSGASDDIGFLVDLLTEQYPNTPILAAGYSLGANALLKYLGETGAACPLIGAVAVCPPLVLSVGADKLNSGVTRGYQHYLTRLMRGQHEAKRARYPELGLRPAGSDLNNFWKFDDAITAPVHGFDGVDDYYAKCSARQFLTNINTSTHILYALDDPFFTKEVLPENDELSAAVTLELSRHGGHVGFVGGGAQRFWLDGRVTELLDKFASPKSAI